MEKIVVLSGAGISAESGISTFRDSGGLWEGHDINEVASINAWYTNPQKVLEFYNARRQAVAKAEPNHAHKKLAELQNEYDINIVTQNVDDLHERAGSENVLHLHGELTYAKCMECNSFRKRIGYLDIEMGIHCDKGHQLRPDIVWFGEEVPAMQRALELVLDADICLLVGTSLEVYPAAGLVHYANDPVYVIDPNVQLASRISKSLIHYKKTAVEGIEDWISDIKKGPAKTGPFT